MNYIRITAENIEKEHICCAMSNNQSAQKKEWLKLRFDEGLVFYRSEERGKCFIEYIPAEYAWQWAGKGKADLPHLQGLAVRYNKVPPLGGPAA